MSGYRRNKYEHGPIPPEEEGQSLPCDLHAEAGLLGAILLGGEPVLRRALLLLEPADFYEPKHRRILEALMERAEQGEPIDGAHFVAWIAGRADVQDFGGAPYVADLGKRAASESAFENYAGRVLEASKQRRAAEALSEGRRRVLVGEEAGPVLVEALAGSVRRWSPPVPLTSGPELPRFPLYAFPEPLHRYLSELARALQVPHDLVGALGLAALATALGRCFTVSPRRGWEEPVNLFVILIQAPGGLKSAILGAMRGPFDDFEREEGQRAAPVIAKLRQERELLELRLKRLKECAARPPKKEGKTGEEGTEPGKSAEDLRAQIGRLAEELARFEIPAVPCLILDDVTPERLALEMKEQGGRIAVWSPEGSIFDIMSGRYTRGEANLEVFLQGHAGDALKVDRLGRDPIRVYNPSLTLAITVQPAVLEGLASREGFQGRGLLARFLYAVPVSLVGYRETDPDPVSEESTRVYRELMLDLIRLGKPQQTERLTLSPEAKQVFSDFRAELEPMLREDGPLGDLQDWAGKLSGAILRIGGLLHLARSCAEGESWNRPISSETMRAAILVGRWATEHARAAHASMGALPGQDDARRLLRWLRGEPRTVFKATDALQATRGRLKNMERVRAGLKILEDHAYIRPLEAPAGKRGAGRPPSPRYEVNPHLYAQDRKSPQSPQSEGASDSTDSGDIGEGA